MTVHDSFDVSERRTIVRSVEGGRESKMLLATDLSCVSFRSNHYSLIYKLNNIYNFENDQACVKQNIVL